MLKRFLAIIAVTSGDLRCKGPLLVIVLACPDENQKANISGTREKVVGD